MSSSTTGLQQCCRNLPADQHNLTGIIMVQACIAQGTQQPIAGALPATTAAKGAAGQKRNANASGAPLFECVLAMQQRHAQDCPACLPSACQTALTGCHAMPPGLVDQPQWGQLASYSVLL